MPQSSAPPTILVVLSDEHQAREVEEHLRAWGYEVLRASGHMRALTLLDDAVVDLALVQAQRTDLEGKEFCRLVRNRIRQDFYPPLWLVFLGAEEERVRVAQEANEADDLLLSPFHWTELRWRVEHGLRHLRTLQQLRDGSRKDTGTGLFSQSGFRSLLREEVNRLARKQDWFSLLALHLSGLETVYRDLGAAWTKWFVVDWGRHLLTRLRDYDKLAEVTPERLCLLAPEVPPQGGVALCRRIRNDFEDYCRKNLPASGGGLHLICQGFSVHIDVPVDGQLQAAEEIMHWAVQPFPRNEDRWRQGRLHAEGFEWREEGR